MDPLFKVAIYRWIPFSEWGCTSVRQGNGYTRIIDVRISWEFSLISHKDSELDIDKMIGKNST